MRTSGNRSRIVAGGLAALLALGGVAHGSGATVSAETDVFAAAPAAVVHARWRAVRVPPGILAGVPTGASPGGVRLRTVYPPYPAGFEADPYFTPPATITVPPPIVFAPPPFLYDIAPVAPPFDGGWISRPY